MTAQGTLLTVGHSTHSLDVFLDLLRKHRVSVVADVRHSLARRSVSPTRMKVWTPTKPEKHHEYIHDRLHQEERSEVFRVAASFFHESSAPTDAIGNLKACCGF